MEQNRITIDTHTLVWYLHQPSRHLLSTRALEVITLAENSGVIYVPSVALLEILWLIEKGKFPLIFSDLLSQISKSASYKLIPLDAELLKVVPDIDNNLELHDRTIAATAVVTDTGLVSTDSVISNVYTRVIW